MKYIKILLMLLCIFCLTGCQKTEKESEETYQEPQVVEEEAERTDNVDEKPDESHSENQEGESQEDEHQEAERDPMEEINEHMIPEQSFDVFLNDWGEVTFVTCKPASGYYDSEDFSFFLVRDNQILYQFPWQFEDNDLGAWRSLCGIGAVSFRNINNDKKKDIIIIKYFVTGVGSQGMTPRPIVTIYLAGENEFYIAEEMIADVEEHIEGTDVTIENICNYLKYKE